jgi:hypothetical protein
MPAPAQPLPAELEEFMQGSGDDGVILVSFGSMIDTLNDYVVDVMNKAFSKVSQKVLWRLKPGKRCGVNTESYASIDHYITRPELFQTNLTQF